VEGALLSVLNSPDAELSAQEAAVQLVAALALRAENAEWVLGVLGQLNTEFSRAFKTEELWSDTEGRGPAVERSLHTWLVVALVRVMDTQLRALEVLQMTDGIVPVAVNTLLMLCDMAAAGSLPDSSQQMVHSTRLLFELTTFDATFDEESCESFADLKKATAAFQQQNNELIAVVLKLPVLAALIRLLGDAVASAPPSDEAAVYAAVRFSLKMLHNLLLYSTEKSTQLRKHIANSGFVTAVLDPFLVCQLADYQQPSADAARRHSAAINSRTALKIICVATFKVGVLRQHYAESELLRRCMQTFTSADGDGAAGPAMADTAKAVTLLARTACNLDSPGRAGGLLDMLCCYVRGLEDGARQLVRQAFWEESAVVPVVRTCAAHQRLSAADVLGAKPPTDATKPTPAGGAAAGGQRCKTTSPESSDQSNASQGAGSSAMSKSKRSKLKRQRKRERLRAQHVQLMGGAVDHPGAAFVPGSASSASTAEPKGVAEDEGDDIPEELPAGAELGAQEDDRRCAAGATRRILVRPRAPGDDEEGDDEGSSGGSDFETDDILQEVSELHIQLLASR